MKIAIGFVAGVVVMAALSVFTTAQQQAAVDEQALKREVNAFMDQYWSLWSSGQIDQLVERIYHPMGQLSNTGHASIEQLKQNFPATRKTLLAGNYGRSNMPVRNICILGNSVAVVSGKGIRYLQNGDVMAEFGWTYTLLKGQNGWKMVAIYSHDPKKALVCSN